MNVNERHIIFLFLTVFTMTLSAQTISEGEVSFVTSGNVYVRFSNTDNINENDTLSFLVEGIYKSCLIVKQKSSSSCVCTQINDCEFKKGDKIFFEEKAVFNIEQEVVNEIEVEAEEPTIYREENSFNDDVIPRVKKLKLQKINARLSAATYSSIDENDNRNRAMMRFSMNAFNINDSKWSFETYTNYRHEFSSDTSFSARSNKQFRIYNAALSYDLDSLSRITLGRKVNRKMSSIGAIDGLQLDKSFGDFYTGLVVGFRPDHTRFDLNTNLLEYGLYVGKDIRSQNVNGQITIGVLEQKNNGFTDRRYTYAQFNTSLFRKLNVFTSAEMDLYSKVNEIAEFKPRLTNLYVSLNYRFSRKISLMVSYDARRNIIFYETFQTEIERLLADDEAREGIRTRLSFRPFRFVYLGLSYSKRFQSGSSNKFDNINGFVSFSKIPVIGGRVSLTYNLNKSSYLESKIYSVRYNRSLVPRKLDFNFYFRYVDYLYLNYENTLQQQFFGSGLSYRISKSLSLSLFGELSQYSDRNRMRLNTKLIKRF